MYIFTKLALIAKSGLKETAPCSSSEIAEQSVVYQLLPHLLIWEYFTWLSSGSELVSMWETLKDIHTKSTAFVTTTIFKVITSIGLITLTACLHETRSELKPIWNLKPFWNVLITWQFTWRFHCGNFPNNSKTLLHICKWYLLINAKLNYIMQNRCCTIGCFLNNSGQAHTH